MKQSDSIVWSAVPTTAGSFTLGLNARGVAGLYFPDDPESPRPCPVPPAFRALWKVTGEVIEKLLQGRQVAKLPPLDLNQGTAFQQSVWRALSSIPRGETRRYAALAQVLGRPNAARAVGNACGANRIPLLIPCHRVLPQAGGCGGFSGPAGWKRRLLQAEGVTIAEG